MDTRQTLKDDVRSILEEELVTPILAPTLALARAQTADLVAVTTELDAFRTLLAGAPELLELAATVAEQAARFGCPLFYGDSTYNTVPAQLRELTRALRVAMGEEEER